MQRNQIPVIIEQGPHVGNCIPNQGTGAPYHDPVHVRQWAEMSAASIDSFPGSGPDPFPNNGLCFDFASTGAMDSAVSLAAVSAPDMQTSSMDFTRGLDLSMQCTSSSTHMDYNHDMTSAMSGFQGHEMDFSLVQNECQLDESMAFPNENLVYTTPLLNDVSFFESAGAHSMCHQDSTQGYLNCSTEWDSMDSSPELNGAPMAQIISASPTVNMALLNENTWPIGDAVANGINGNFQSVGAPDFIQMPPAHYAGDQRFECFVLAPHCTILIC